MKIFFFKFNNLKTNLFELKKGFARGGHFHDYEVVHTLVFGKIEHRMKNLDSKKETIEILQTMRADEDAHAQQAVENGGEELEIPTKKIMKYTAKVMTSTSTHI